MRLARGHAGLEGQSGSAGVSCMKFFNGICKGVSKLRIAVIAFWLAAAAVVWFTAPVLSEVARTDESSFLKSNTETAQASALYKELFPEAGSGSSFIVVLTDGKGLNDADRAYAKSLEAFLMAEKDTYKIREINSPIINSKLEEALISADGQAAVMQVNLSGAAYTSVVNEAVNALKRDIKGDTAAGDAPDAPAGLTVNITGDAPLGQEYIDNVKKSLNMTTAITVILIVVILLLIYRSPLAPMLPLATIGLSFLISRGVVALLTTLGFTVSSFTEIFMIAVLFGAGTDYCLLLISRFREEIVAGKSPKEALAAAYPHTAAAIISSGGTVIIGFIGMSLADFGLFSSTGPSIAIGVAVTMLAVLTLTPALISMFGEILFWPAHPSKNREREQAGSPFWNKLSAAVTRRPVTFLLVTLGVLLPFMILSANVTRTFDSLKEMPATAEAVQGFEHVKAHFNQGEVLPVKIVMKTDKNMWDNASLQAVDNIADSLLKVDGVARVRTATRPGGGQIDEISLPEQIRALTGGLTSAGGSFDTLKDALTQARDGADQVADGVASGKDGMDGLSNGTAEAASGISQVGGGLGELSKADGSAISGVGKLKAGMGGLSGGLDESKAGLNSMLAALNSAKAALEAMAAKNPALMMDPNFKTAFGTVQALIGNIPAMSGGIDAMKAGVTQSQKGLADAGTGLKKIKDGIDGAKSALGKASEGLNTIKARLDEAAAKLDLAASSLKQVSDGLTRGIDAVDEMKAALLEAGDSATEWAGGLKGLNSVFYLPGAVLEKYPELKEYMRTYISQDGHGVTFDVVLKDAPYSKAALDSVSGINGAVRFALKGSALEGAEFHVSGTTGAYSELRAITEADFIKVMIFVLLGIFVVLAMLLKSLTAPLYLILTIIMSYFTTLGISCLVFQVGFGKDGLSWAVPFFSFCLLVALGVDYNIFLMSRVKEEYRPGDTAGGTARALGSTGKIITSCGLIMAGTFGAMLFSPVMQLVQVGFTTVVGLLLDTFIVRCMLVPAIVVKVGELNWWPGKRVKVVVVEKSTLPPASGIPS